MSFMTDIADLLVYAGAGIKGTSIFVGRMPDSPDECVSVMPYQGLPPMYVQERSGPAYQRPSFQVLIRGARDSTLATEARAAAIHDYLAAVSNQSVNGTFYLAIRPNAPAFPLTRDGNDRDLWVVNAQAVHRS
ncbi:MAG: minor capsid protein [Vicinamibacterales bacterium]